MQFFDRQLHGWQAAVALVALLAVFAVAWPFLVGAWFIYLISQRISSRLSKGVLIAVVAVAMLFTEGMWIRALTLSNSATTPRLSSLWPQLPSFNKPNFQPQSGDYHTVTRVIDGDTIVIDTGQRVRYIGVDTPETVDLRRPVQCFGKEASQKNKELVLNKRVWLEKDVRDTDRYGRLLRYVFIDGDFINDDLVRQGYAYASSFPPDVKYQERFRQAEQEARSAQRGLWASCPPR